MTDTFFFHIDDQPIGYIRYRKQSSVSSGSNTKIFIEYILVYKAKRGNNYSKNMFEQFSKQFPECIFELVAKEDMNKYGKLFGLYTSLGFTQIGKTSYYSDNDTTYRKSLFQMVPSRI